MAAHMARTIPLGFARQCLLRSRQQQLRAYTNSAPPKEASRTPESARSGLVDIDALLAEPTWSVSSLLPPETPSADSPKITSKQLHHLLRLSALPPPTSPEDEQKMLSTLQAQLHFVREIQRVDTTGVEPLTSLRDETARGDKEAELGLEALKDALEAEEVRGKFHPRIRRKKQVAIAQSESVDEWDVLGCASKKVGRYFVVEGGKD